MLYCKPHQWPWVWTLYLTICLPCTCLNGCETRSGKSGHLNWCVCGEGVTTLLFEDQKCHLAICTFLNCCSMISHQHFQIIYNFHSLHLSLSAFESVKHHAHYQNKIHSSIFQKLGFSPLEHFVCDNDQTPLKQNGIYLTTMLH